jgi:hypothetical protein
VFRGSHTLKRSLNRAKVFGGALTMAAASRIGMGRAADTDLTIVFEDSITQLNNHHINFGAHTADHVAEGREDIDAGCGAIDGAPAIIEAAVKYEEPIRASIKALGIDDTGLDTVFANYRAYAETLPTQKSYSGRVIMDKIVSAGKVVKQLVGAHKECRIVLNNVRDFTINQALVREVTDDQAQVFAVDVWRLTDIANTMYEGLPGEQRAALQSQVVYTLATAAVLTKGDLPVDVIQEAAEPV